MLQSACNQPVANLNRVFFQPEARHCRLHGNRQYLSFHQKKVHAAKELSAPGGLVVGMHVLYKVYYSTYTANLAMEGQLHLIRTWSVWFA